MCYTFSMKGILKESTIETLKNVKNIFRNIAIWTLIGGLVLGGFLIMFGGTESADVIGRIMGTFLVLGLAMLVSTITISRLDSDKAFVQILALIGLISNFVWFVMWTICIWVTGPETVLTLHNLYSIATMFSILAIFGLVGACTLNMFEGNKKGIIRPLKITSVVCFGIVCLYNILGTFNSFGYHDSIFFGGNTFFATQDELWARFSTLSAFAWVGWLITLIIAGINSSSEHTRVKKEQKKAAKLAAAQAAADAQAAAAQTAAVAQAAAEAKLATKSDDELRAEIEEKVRREMIEKEVRAKLEKEMKKK